MEAMIALDMSHRQLALTLAVEAYGDRAPLRTSEVERLADRYYKYLTTGVMGR